MPDIRPTLSQKLSKTINRVRRRGPKELLGLALDRVREAFGSSDTLLMFCRPAGGEVQEMASFEFRELHEGDALAYASCIGTDSPTTFTARLTSRTRCFAVVHEGTLVHASWVTTAAAWTRELHRYLTPPPGDAYIYESFTRPEVRGRGIYPFALRNLSALVGKEGVRTLWVAVEEDNVPSIKAVTKAAFEEAFALPYRRRVGRVELVGATGPRAGEALRFVSVSPHE